MKNNSYRSIISLSLVSLTLMFLIYILGFTIRQSDFGALISAYAIFFLLYLFVLYFIKSENTIWFFVGLGIFLRLMLVFSFPNLSDDIYRFIWDGRLINHGINPFNHLPEYFLQAGNEVSGLTQSLFEKLNSPDYYTIYPPLSQAIFAIACWVAPDSYWGSALLMKTFMFLFECGSIFLIIKILRHYNLPVKNVLIYALNPLIILEITGNLHFEGAMIFFLLLSIWFLIQKRNDWSAVFFALSIVSKLLPLIFLPFLIKRLGWKKSLRYFLILGFTALLCFSPLLNTTFVNNFMTSLDLYFQKFEFNASIYYLLRWLGNWVKGYNMIRDIGPVLAIMVLLILSFRAYKERLADFNNLFSAFLFAISVYLFLATTIHPWYTAMPLLLCIFTRFRFPVLWTGLIMLTYINYSYPEYYENLWMVGLEYGLVFGYLGYELFISKNGLLEPNH